MSDFCCFSRIFFSKYSSFDLNYFCKTPEIPSKSTEVLTAMNLIPLLSMETP